MYSGQFHKGRLNLRYYRAKELFFFASVEIATEKMKYFKLDNVKDIMLIT